MKWLVLLEDVKKSDFDNLSNLLRSSDEFSSITENSKYYLTSSRWESLTNTSDVYWEATKRLQHISAVARIQFTDFPLLKPDIAILNDLRNYCRGNPTPGCPDR
jgi:hypothetical protein